MSRDASFFQRTGYILHKLAHRAQEIIDESKRGKARESEGKRELYLEKERERESKYNKRETEGKCGAVCRGQNEKLLVSWQSVEVSIIRKGAGTDISWN